MRTAARFIHSHLGRNSRRVHHPGLLAVRREGVQVLPRGVLHVDELPGANVWLEAYSGSEVRELKVLRHQVAQLAREDAGGRGGGCAR